MHAIRPNNVRITDHFLFGSKPFTMRSFLTTEWCCYKAFWCSFGVTRMRYVIVLLTEHEVN